MVRATAKRPQFVYNQRYRHEPDSEMKQNIPVRLEWLEMEAVYGKAMGTF